MSCICSSSAVTVEVRHRKNRQDGEKLDDEGVMVVNEGVNKTGYEGRGEIEWQCFDNIVFDFPLNTHAEHLAIWTNRCDNAKHSKIEGGTTWISKPMVHKDFYIDTNKSGTQRNVGPCQGSKDLAVVHPVVMNLPHVLEFGRVPSLKDWVMG